MSYPPTPTGMMPYGHYYPQYATYSAAGTPTGMQPAYPYPFAAPPGFMHNPGVYGMAAPQSMQQYAMDDAAMDDEEGAMEEEDEDVDMEMPLDQSSAERAMRHMIYTKLFQQGFDSGKSTAVDALLKEVVGFMQNLYLSTQEYGAQAGRSAPGVQDFVAACDEIGITAKMLNPSGSVPLLKVKPTPSPSKLKPKKRKRRRRAGFDPRHANLIPRDLSSPEPELLPAEDMPHVPATLRAFHASNFLPSYPPKHTYIRSPPSPPQRSTLTANLDKRMQNTAKVRQALKNLMDAAEKEEEQEAAGSMSVEDKGDASKYKLTHSTLVNWQESFTLTRKRWKVGR